MQMPTEISIDPVNYTLLVNRDQLQIRDGVVYSDLHKAGTAFHTAILNGGPNVDACGMQLAFSCLIAIINGSGQPQRLAEWALQGFSSSSVKEMLKKEALFRAKKNNDLANMKTLEEKYLTASKAADEELKRYYSESGAKPTNQVAPPASSGNNQTKEVNKTNDQVGFTSVAKEGAYK